MIEKQNKKILSKFPKYSKHFIYQNVNFIKRSLILSILQWIT